MADNQQQPKKEAAKQPNDKSIGLATWLIMLAIITVSSGSGFVLARLFAKPAEPVAVDSNQIQTEPAAAEQQKTETKPQAQAKDTETSDVGNWYYDLDAVVANLDEPGVTRYVRAVITLEVSSKYPKNSATAIFDEKKPILTHWLNIYFAGLSLDEIRGEKNLKRIQSYILDSFNENMFGTDEPMLKDILFKEFAIQ